MTSVKIKGVDCILFKDAATVIESEIGIKPARSTIYDYIKKGKLPKTLPFRVGNQAVFSEQDLREYARERLITNL